MAEMDTKTSPYAYVFNNPMRFIDPDGIHVGNDGIDDNKAYLARTTSDTQLSQEQSLNYTTTASVVPVGSQADLTAVGGNPVVQQLDLSNSDLVKLAGMAYAESNAKGSNKEETYGIASASVNNYNERSQDPRSGNKSFSDVLNKISNATFDGNVRYGKFMGASNSDRNSSSGMTMAIGAAVNATSGGRDYSNGATGWDGRDLPTNSHRFGLNMASPSHDIYGMGDRPLSNGGYVRQTTGAAGHSVFIRIHPAFVKKGSPNY